jgi:hypothetical protein
LLAGFLMYAFDLKGTSPSGPPSERETRSIHVRETARIISVNRDQF